MIDNLSFILINRSSEIKYDMKLIQFKSDFIKRVLSVLISIIGILSENAEIILNTIESSLI